MISYPCQSFCRLHRVQYMCIDSIPNTGSPTHQSNDQELLLPTKFISKNNIEAKWIYWLRFWSSFFRSLLQFRIPYEVWSLGLHEKAHQQLQQFEYPVVHQICLFLLRFVEPIRGSAPELWHMVLDRHLPSARFSAMIESRSARESRRPMFCQNLMMEKIFVYIELQC